MELNEIWSWFAEVGGGSWLCTPPHRTPHNACTTAPERVGGSSILPRGPLPVTGLFPPCTQAPASPHEKTLSPRNWQPCRYIAARVTQLERTSEQSTRAVCWYCPPQRTHLLTGRRGPLPFKMQMPVVLWAACTSHCWQLQQALLEHPLCASHRAGPGGDFLVPGKGSLCQEGRMARGAGDCTSRPDTALRLH